MANKGKLPKFKIESIESRPERIRRYQYLFLIVCEDEKTEPQYFATFQAKFPEKTLYLKAVGSGKDPIGVVEKAIHEKQLLEIIARKEVDEVWVVFDKDDADENQTKIQKFENAFQIADENKFEVAYSNEVFELWLLLHLKNIDSNQPIPRVEIYSQLSAQIQKTPKYSEYIYDHKRPNPQTIDIILEIGSCSLAIERAKALLIKQKNLKPIAANPSTKVHLLVEKINEWLTFYNYSK